MRILKTLLVLLAVLATVFLGVGLALPDRARVERSVLIDASPATVYTVLNGFRQFNRWSPWADIDPQTVYTYSGPPTGVGARQRWTSQNPAAGSGSQEILEATPYAAVKVRLQFDGMDVDNLLTYSLSAEGSGTRLVWTYESDFNGNVLNRYFGLLLDKMIGPDFDKGLARLKPLAESLPRTDFTAVQPEVVEVDSLPIAYVPGEAPYDGAAPLVQDARDRIAAFIAAAGRRASGEPLLITESLDASTRLWKFIAAIPLDAACTPPDEANAVRCGKTYAGWAIRGRHVGADAAIESSVAALTAFKLTAGLEDNGARWQQRLSDPGVTTSETSHAQLVQPVK